MFAALFRPIFRPNFRTHCFPMTRQHYAVADWSAVRHVIVTRQRIKKVYINADLKYISNKCIIQKSKTNFVLVHNE